MRIFEHLLTTLGEECAEVAQRISKALRFGLAETQEGHKLNNVERIMEEYRDVQALMEMCNERGILPPPDFSRAEIEKKKRRVIESMGYAEAQGSLSRYLGESFEPVRRDFSLLSMFGVPWAPGDRFMIAHGSDGYEARVVYGWQLCDAYVAIMLDSSHSMAEREECLAPLLDNDNWTFDYERQRISYTLKLEDGWVEIFCLNR
jgi:hypothetical protein